VTGAAEVFAIELGRAAKRNGHLLSGLKQADRDDAIAAAMLDAWEKRETLKGAKLEEWFADILRIAVRHIKRSSRSQSYSVMKINEIAAPDSTSQSAEALSGAEELAKKLTMREQQVAMKLAEGYSQYAISVDLDMPKSELKKITRKLKKLNSRQDFSAPRAPYAPPLDSDHREVTAAPIDHAIEALLRRPANTTADCVVCWKCMWFDGLTPAHYHPPQLVEPEIQAAVEATEARKIQIGNGERL
jgi:DNA-directed RNA polymerase specialized sigma24 family protein